MAEQETKSIIFYQGEENGIVVETKDYKYSIFSEQYKQAFQVFERIHNQQLPLNMLYDNDTRGKGASVINIEVDNQYSNVIAFCGDRGEGKSSCMSSFAMMLAKEEGRRAAVEAGLTKCDFVLSGDVEVLDTIDPSSFDSEHNLLELLVGRMFSHIKEEIFIHDDCVRTDGVYEQRMCKRTKLLKQFEKVKCSMSILNKQKDIYDSLEDVDDLAVGVRLKKEITELFRLYLCYEDKKQLVLCIDDLDLNMTEGYKMAEMIRKYMINPYCIVLVAVKVDQLVDVIAAAIEKEKQGSQIITKERILPMAQKYVVKLLPQSNRIDMPSALDFCNRPFLMLSSRVNGLEESKVNAKVLLKDYVVRLIYLKTRYVFYNGLELSPIVPRNLRELRHFIAKLYVQENAWIHQNEMLVESNQGREAFHEYFFDTWAAKLPDKDFVFAQSLIEYDNISTLNKYVLDYFVSKIVESNVIDVKNLGRDENKLYELITDRNNVAANISFGDVMFVLQTIDKITMNQDIRNLIFLIKTYYHIRMYALYNKISEGEKALFAKEMKEGIRIYRNDKTYDGLNALQRLLNGSVFSYNEGDYLPREGGNKPRDKRTIKCEYLKNIFTLLKENKFDDEVGYIKTLRLCEFFALCIKGTIKSDNKGANFTEFDRRSLELPYLGDISLNRKYAIYDFLYPFYSLCNIRYAYGRFDGILGSADALYDMAIKDKDSLLWQLLNRVENFRRNRAGKEPLASNCELNDEKIRWEFLHALISDAIIRVVDVQVAIADYLAFTKDVHRISDDKNSANIRRAYKDIQDLEIKIYSVDKNPDEEDVDSDLWQLHFDFLTVLRDVLGEKHDKTGIDEIQSSLYRGIAIGEDLFALLSRDDEQSNADKTLRNMAVMQLFNSFRKDITFPLNKNQAIAAILNGFDAHNEDRRQLKALLSKQIQKETKFENIDDILAKINELSNDILMWAAMRTASKQVNQQGEKKK